MTTTFEPPECPGEDCPMCNGEMCDKCGAGCWNNSVTECDHGVLDRHEPPAQTKRGGKEVA